MGVANGYFSQKRFVLVVCTLISSMLVTKSAWPGVSSYIHITLKQRALNNHSYHHSQVLKHAGKTSNINVDRTCSLL